MFDRLAIAATRPLLIGFTSGVLVGGIVLTLASIVLLVLKEERSYLMLGLMAAGLACAGAGGIGFINQNAESLRHLARRSDAVVIREGDDWVISAPPVIRRMSVLNHPAEDTLSIETASFPRFRTAYVEAALRKEGIVVAFAAQPSDGTRRASGGRLDVAR